MTVICTYRRKSKEREDEEMKIDEKVKELDEMNSTEDMEELELNDAQIARIDEVHNAVMEMCRVLCEEPELEWNMEFIGEIADVAAEILTRCGKRVRYPAVVTNEDGTQYIEEFYDADGPLALISQK